MPVALRPSDKFKLQRLLKSQCAAKQILRRETSTPLMHASAAAGLQRAQVELQKRNSVQLQAVNVTPRELGYPVADTKLAA